MRSDPFTRTPGLAGEAFINMHYADRIIEDFSNDSSSKYVYKIVGLRGSGKSVEYGKIIDEFKQMDKWLVYTLSAAGNPVETLIAKISKEKFIDSKIHSTSINTGAEADIKGLVVGGGASVSVTKSSTDNAKYYSAEAELTALVNEVNSEGYRILVGIDDISKTDNMVEFLSIFGTLILDSDTEIYLVCTGLNKNIEDFTSASNLTFFKRSDTAEIRSLDRFEIADKYRQLLGVTQEVAIKMARFVNGYAYAYQVLGTLYFNKKDSEEFEDLIPTFDKIMAQDSYELIWSSLTGEEKSLVKCILQTEDGKVSDIKKLMNNPGNFSSLRNRLMNKHLIDTEERGYVTISLPRFKEFVSMWEM